MYPKKKKKGGKKKRVTRKKKKRRIVPGDWKYVVPSRAFFFLDFLFHIFN